MTQSPRDSANISYAAVIGATVTVVALTILIIWADLMPTVKDWLKTTFSHHWIGKGAVGIIIFSVSGLIGGAGKPKNEDQLAGAMSYLFFTSIVCMLLLGIFFGYEAFLK